MPKSKREKKISLTQTRKKGLEFKQKIIEDVRDCVDKYARIFTFSVQNMRNVQLKNIRQDWKHSRFFFGKNSLMAVALGRTESDEYRENLHFLAQQLKGQTGLLFTNETKKTVLKYFDDYRVPDFARAGNIATQTVTLEQGPIPDLSHAMEPQLRQLGLPTSLQRGVITLLRDHKVCEKGDPITPEQSRILKLFDHMMVDFHVTVEGMWSNNGKWLLFDQRPEPIVPTKVNVKATAASKKGGSDMEEEEDEEEDKDEDNEEG
ncbi:mRNA turnover protein 4 homolog [Patella vulgata]|uniref:mRNA turnover protein 4 homolog n=1 Tax=Patella vulgata TaxID=6465 RepID=UPI00217FE1DA|nr:mRNA turnover protein 4 homolog [Patella vulgata]